MGTLLCRRAAVVAALFWLITASATAQSISVPPSELREALLPPVVRVTVGDTNLGSGFVVARDRVLTVHHVVKDKKKAIVEFFKYDERGKSTVGNTLSAQVLLTDEKSDLALLAVVVPDYVRIGVIASCEEYETLGTFSPIISVNCPFGMDPRPSIGVIASFAFPPPLVGVTAPCNPGSSGAPVFAKIGNYWLVVGVVGGVYTYNGAVISDVSAMISHEVLEEFLEGSK